MKTRFYVRYNLVVTYDSGRQNAFQCFTASDTESRVRQLVKDSRVTRVDVERLESFHHKTYKPVQGDHA